MSIALKMYWKIILVVFSLESLTESKPQYSAYCTVPCAVTQPCSANGYNPSPSPCPNACPNAYPNPWGSQEYCNDELRAIGAAAVAASAAASQPTSILVLRRTGLRPDLLPSPVPVDPPVIPRIPEFPTDPGQPSVSKLFTDPVNPGPPLSRLFQDLAGPEPCPCERDPKKSRLFSSICRIPGAVADSLLSGEVTM